MPTIQERIAEAMDAGYAPQEILKFYKESDDPEHQNWYQTYSEKMQQRGLEPNVEQSKSVATPLLGFIEENPKTVAAVAAGAGGVYLGSKISGIAAERAKTQMAERKTAAYEAQVAKQNLPTALAETQPNGPVGPDPLMEARIRKAAAEADLAEFKTEQARAKIAQAKQAAPAGVVPAPVNLTPADVAARAAGMPVAPPAAPMAPAVPTAPVAPAAPVAEGPLSTAGKQWGDLGTTPKTPDVPEAAVVPPKPVEVAKAEVEGAKPPRIRRTAEQIAADAVLKPGFEFRAGFNTADTYLVDALGPEKYKIARMELNEGKPFGDYNKDLVKGVMDKYRVGEKVTAEAAKAAGAGAMSSPGGVPSKSIQRGVKVAGVLGMGLPAWLAARAAEVPGYEEAMARAGKAVPGLGVSVGVTPFSRGEEMGKLGASYVSAGNPQYRSQLEDQLKSEKEPERRSVLIDELRKIGAAIPPTK